MIRSPRPFLAKLASRRRLHAVAAVAVLAVAPGSLRAQSDTWDGGGGDDNFGTGANWADDTAPSPGANSDLFFAGTTRLTPFNNYNAFDDFRNITFNAGAGAFTIGGNAIDLFGKIENLSTNTQTVNLGSIALNSASANQFNPVNGNLTIGSGQIFTNGNQLNVFGNNGNTLTISGVISQGGNLSVNENSIVVLSGANTYTGETLVNAGEVRIAQGGSPGTGAIRIGGIGTSGSPSAAFNITDADGGTTVTNTIVFRPSTGGTQGTRTLGATNTSGTNTYSGSVALDTIATITSANAGGTLAFTGGSALELKTFGLLVNGAGDTTISKAVTSTGAGNGLTKEGAGILTLSGANTYSGTTAVNAGTLRLSGGSAIADAGAVTIGVAGATLDVTASETVGAVSAGTAGGALALGSGVVLTLGTSSGQTILATISGAGGLTKQGTGALTLGAAGVTNTFAGGLTVNAGGVTAGNTASAFGAGTVTLGATSGTATATLSGSSNTFANPIVVNGGGTGQVTLGSSGNSSSVYSGTIALGRELRVNAATTSGNVRLSGVISGGSGLLLSGGTGGTANFVTLEGANTFTGGVNLANGSLRVNNAGSGGTSSALGTGTLTIAGGTLLDNTTAAALTVSTNNPVTINGDFTFGTTSTTAGSITQSLGLGTGAVSLGTAAGTSRTITSANSARNLNIGGIISNGTTANSLIKAGPGSITLGGANTFTGGVTLSAGNINVNNASALGTGTFLIEDGTTINNVSNAAITLTPNNPVTVNGNFTFLGTGTNAAALNLGTGAVSLGAAAGTTRTITVNGSNLTFGGPVANGTTANSLLKTGAGTLSLGGASTYTGTTTVERGTLRATANAPSDDPGAFGDATSPIVLGTALSTQNERVTLLAGAPDVTISRNIQATEPLSTGADGNSQRYRIGTDIASGTATIAGNISYGAATGTRRILGLVAAGAGGTVDFTGVISQISGGVSSGAVTINEGNAGTGTVRLSNSGNSYNVTTNITNGTLLLGGSVGASGNSVIGTSTGNLGLADGATPTTGATLRVLNDGAFTFARGIVLGNASGTASFTAVLGGTTAGTSAFSSTIGGGNDTDTKLLQLTAVAGGTVNFTGDIGANAGTGAVSVEKTGAGTVTFGGTAANSFDGTLTVSAGTLEANKTDSARDTTAVTVNSGGTLLLGGTGTLNRINNAAPVTLAGGTLSRGATAGGEGTGGAAIAPDGPGGGTNANGLGALTLSAANSTLDFGTGSVGTLTFAEFTPGSFTLTVNNWTGTPEIPGTDGNADRLIFAGGQLNPAELQSIVFTGFDPTLNRQFELGAAGSGYFEIVPVPEPGTVAAGLLALGALGLGQRRRVRRWLATARKAA